MLRVYSRSAASRNQTSLALSALGPFVCVRIWRSASANQSIVAPPDYLGDRNPLELIQSIIVVSTATFSM